MTVPDTVRFWLHAEGLAAAGAAAIIYDRFGGSWLLDRLLGFGLKHLSGFKDTHLQRA